MTAFGARGSAGGLGRGDRGGIVTGNGKCCHEQGRQRRQPTAGAVQSGWARLSPNADAPRCDHAWQTPYAAHSYALASCQCVPRVAAGQWLAVRSHRSHLAGDGHSFDTVDSSYSTNAEITTKYGIPRCGSTTGTAGNPSLLVWCGSPLDGSLGSHPAGKVP